VCWFGAKAQTTADSLAPVTVSATRFTQFTTGTKTAAIDSITSVTFQTQTLAELLASQSQVFIKSYGQGIASASFRGSSAEQTAVLWKGFNLQNPMFGQVDFSLIQGDAADRVEVQYGGNGALFGSGAVGGTVQLLSKARYGSGLHGSAGLQLGSFGHIRTQAGLSYGSAKWFSTIRVFGLSVENDFPYTNTFLPGNPEVKQTNAAAKQKGFINENYFRLTPAQELNVNIWYQYANRQVPPGMSVPVTEASQIDKTFRTTAEWKLNQQWITWAARTAYFDESIEYTNPVSLLLSGNSRSQTVISEGESTIRLQAAHRINIGVNNTYTHAFADGYEGSFNRNRTALFVSYKTDQLIRNLTTSLSVRQEWTAGTDIPLMPAFGFEWKATRWLNVFGNVSRSYRLPTFNELYWKSVTTHVQPESGWGEELNLRTQTSVYGFNFTATAGVFNRNIQNWIVWLPSTIDWAPQNIKEVWSRGAEFDGKLSYALNKVTLSYHFMVNYVLSTNKASNIANDDAVGKQLLYVPRITQQHQLMAAFRTWHIGLLQNYVSLRYTTTDNTTWLDGYSLTSLVAGKQFNLRKTAFVMSAQANNLFNISYQAIADRPMPGRNFLLNTTFKF
jgi:iron complex outermembrane receptor protein